MPIYEYRCDACGFQKEYLLKMSDAPPTDCPECGKASLSKMVTAAGFQLKGSGWYATDFKHGPKPKSKPEDKPAMKSDQSAAKPDEKPAAKPDDKPAPAAPAKKSDTATSSATSGAGTNPVSS
jgi:putative FmdB family regulatory protein